MGKKMIEGTKGQLDIDSIRISLPQISNEQEQERGRIGSKWIEGRFVRGPIAWDWLAAAACLPGCALHVAVALHYLDGFEQKGTVRLRQSICRELGMDRHTVYRALEGLEDAGLVRVRRKQGACPMVTIQERLR